LLLPQLDGFRIETPAKLGGGLTDRFLAIGDDPARLGLVDTVDDVLKQGIEISPQRLLQLLR